MRQEHKAGEKMFVDYCGQTVSVVDRESGESREAQIFVAVLGASNYTYAEATWTQTTPDCVASHVQAFEYFQGVTELVIQDNLKSGVARACRYEPQLTATYGDALSYYATAGLPTRVRHPKDKAKVEVGVQVTERWILARLRHQKFFSLPELNSAIRRLLEELNQRPFRKLEPELKKPITITRGMPVYDEAFYKAIYNPDSVDNFMKYADELNEFVKQREWELELKFNKSYCGFKAGFFNAFGIKWIGSKTIAFFFKVPKEEAKKIKPEMTRYETPWKEAVYYIEPGKTKISDFEKLFELAYKKFSGD